MSKTRTPQNGFERAPENAELVRASMLMDAILQKLFLNPSKTNSIKYALLKNMKFDYSICMRLFFTAALQNCSVRFAAPCK